jgi:hypothetical protein
LDFYWDLIFEDVMWKIRFGKGQWRIYLAAFDIQSGFYDVDKRDRLFLYCFLMVGFTGIFNFIIWGILEILKVGSLSWSF